MKQKELVNKSDISNPKFSILKKSDLNTKLATLATKAGFTAEQDKISKYKTVW